MSLTEKQKRFNNFLPIVIWTVFALIAIGGLVRSTGSGMGCPDWPKCFGTYIPPTDISQLPADYKTKFSVAGRLVADFNVVKTWTEYINRLFGVWTGIASLILSYFAFSYKESRPKVFWYTQSALLLVIFNGWLGSKVVSTHLMPGIITAHMVLAILLVFVLVRLKHIVSDFTVDFSSLSVDKLKKYKTVALVLTILIFVQIVLGTQVREQIDHITNTDPGLPKSQWLGKLNAIFFVHRSYSIVLLIGLFYLLRNLMQDLANSLIIQQLCVSTALICFAEIAAGVALAYFSFPALAQPIHLLLSVFLVTNLFEIRMILNKRTE